MATNKTGSRGQLRTTLPTATTLFSFESLVFQPFEHAAEHRTSELQRGQRTASKGSQGCMTRTTMGATVIRTTCSEGGCVWKCEHLRRTPCRFSPPGALSAPKGGWPYTEATPSGAAPTSPPEGVFRHKRRMELVELSGRTTGRLGYTWPTTAYAIGGTATLALRYSIIPATTAARTRPQ